MLSNVSFAKKLNQQPKFQSIGDNQPTPGQEYYISVVGQDLVMRTHPRNTAAFTKPEKFDPTQKSQQTWIFEKNDDGSFRIRNPQKQYLTSPYMRGDYLLLNWNPKDVYQRFIYEKGNIKCPETDMCLELTSWRWHPVSHNCPRPVDIKKLVN